MDTHLRPPGFSSSPLAFRQAWLIRHDPLRFLEQLAHQHGDIAFFQLGSRSFFLLNHPNFIRLVLDDRQDDFVCCQGLLNPQPWPAEDQPTQPADIRQMLEKASPRLIETAAHLAASWQDGALIDLQAEMGCLANSLPLIDNHLWRMAGEMAACALTWTLALLASQPELQQRLDTEICTALAGRLPALSDLEGLPLTRQMVNEALRLYPPSWLVVRQAVSDTLICGYVVPSGGMILMSPWVMQRDARFFPNPLSFDPGRWVLEPQHGLPKYAFFPFGAGSQAALADELLQVAGPLLLAGLSQNVFIHGRRFSRLPGHRSFAVQPSDLLRPKHGMRIVIGRKSLS
ncbi:MAG: cytochrome P450 [Anaerolineales bacterium]|nr:cytochrome P450 [Anaerolineales bacterium]